MNATFWVTAATERVFVIETSVVLYEHHIEAAGQSEGVDSAWIQSGDIPTLCIRVDGTLPDLDLPKVLAKCLLATFGTGKWIMGGNNQTLLEEVSIYARHVDEQHSVFIV